MVIFTAYFDPWLSPPPFKRKTGFAAMSPERRRELGSRGGVESSTRRRARVAQQKADAHDGGA